MPFALTDDHVVLADVASAFLTEREALGAAREALDGNAGLPAWWPEIAGLGWLGLHISEDHGGQGFGLAELAVVVEALGAVVAPVPVVSTSVVAAIVDRWGSAELRASCLPGLVDGTMIGAVARQRQAALTGDGVMGDVGVAADAAHAGVVLVRCGEDMAVVAASSFVVRPLESFDPTRPFGHVVVDGPALGICRGAAREAERIERVLLAAEAAGVARACTALSVEYAKVREQFGRPIGSFQAVKHHCADMLVASELAASAAWDAARDARRTPGSGELAAAVAVVQAVPAAQGCAQLCIQIHGGIGYTWEHDAHLYLRRAITLAALADPARAAADVTDFTRTGCGWAADLELPSEADEHRASARGFRASLDRLAPEERRGALIDSGYFVPHWPRPWGRGADVVEQLVIDEELSDVEHPDLGIGRWVLLTLVQHATPAQADRWIRPALVGTERWCQLFSEPNAGSDAAAIATRAVRTDGGWLVNGQKVWTSDAIHCSMGLATVRTDADAPKHAGVSMFAVDLRAPGVEIRPLREITGETLFNEVFFDDVFVPDDDVVGEVGQGWAVARATLGNERVSIGSSNSELDLTVAEELVDLADRYAAGDTGTARNVGELIAESHAMRSLNLRHVMRALIGGPPGPEGNLTKLLSAEHAQRVTSRGMEIAGLSAVTGAEPRLARAALFARCLTIAGGTSEILRNVIAERLLGLPRG